jgi:hypothetical protein
VAQESPMTADDFVTVSSSVRCRSDCVGMPYQCKHENLFERMEFGYFNCVDSMESVALSRKCSKVWAD